ncbi:hypothetical protein HDU84_003837 [Entophlyctis sp. JEL0112]|nr:hypothetical protein HDU84_003837 [Entophlyctis sp. JEL0112]
MTKYKRLVLLGSQNHQDVLIDRIAELDSKIGTIESADGPIDPTHFTPACFLDPRVEYDRAHLINKLKQESLQRTQELEFIRLNCTNRPQSSSSTYADVSDLENDKVARDTAATTDSTGVNESLSTPSEPTLDPEEMLETMRVTHETFGEVEMLREYTIKRKEKLFRKPRVRQFFSGNVLHRSTQEMHSSWTEIYCDLLYVGVFSKAGLLVTNNQSWNSVLNFVFLMVPSLTHWMQFTSYNNLIHHEDLYLKIHTFILMVSLMLMGNSLVHAFDSSPGTNTSAVFLASYIFSRVYLIVAQLFVIWVFNSKFRLSTTPNLAMRSISIIPYAVLCAFPVDGTEMRERMRTALWTFASLIEICSPFVYIPIMRYTMKRVNAKHRPAVNIEHTSERTGALYVIALGTVATTFLYDSRSTAQFGDAVGVMALALLIGMNLNHLYFRAEAGSHFKHAMRRTWYTGTSWSLVHIPLVISTLTLGSVMFAMIQTRFSIIENSVPPVALGSDYKDIYFVSLGVIYLCFIALQLLHQEHPQPKETDAARSNSTSQSNGTSAESSDAFLVKEEQPLTAPRHQRRRRHRKMPNLSRKARLAVLGLSVAVFLGVGLAVSESAWSVESMLGISAGVTTVSVFAMEWGILMRKQTVA